MTNSASILAAIKAAAPPGRELTEATLARLRGLSAALVSASSDSLSEYKRYLSVTDREIQLPKQRVTEYLAGRTVLVTGASGCIGTALLRQLTSFHPDRLVTVDLAPAPAVPGISHYQLDIRNRQTLNHLVAGLSPDFVFHLAAQRDPGLAEQAVHRTVTTNVLGTHNLVEACANSGVDHLIFASTGKALRPYTPHVYAASKRAAELIVADAATRGVARASAARFTHVVDNAIILDRLRNWCRRSELIQLHASDVSFYVQSALESAQLLIVAALSPRSAGLNLNAIRNLDWPVSLLDLAVGAMAEHGVAPLQIKGHDPGYEEQSYPGLYDPMFAGEVSPLINMFEAPVVQTSSSPDVDLVVNTVRLSPDARQRLDELETICAKIRRAQPVRALFERLSRAMLEVTLDQASTSTLHRVVRLTQHHRHRLTQANLLIDNGIRARIEQNATRQDMLPTRQRRQPLPHENA